MKDRSSGTMLLDSVPFPLGFLDFFFFLEVIKVMFA